MRERNIQNDGRRAVDVDLEFNSTDYTETGGVPADRSAEVLGKKSGEAALRREERTASIKSKSINLRKKDKAASKEVSETVPLSDKAKAALKEEAETALLENGTDEQTAETVLLKKDSRPSKEKKGSGFVISERILVVHTDEEIGM